jgi:hypothetical protein
LPLLCAARERAREQSWHTASALGEARTALDTARRGERKRLAAAAISGEDPGADPIAAAQAAVAAAGTEAERIEKTEAALDAEIRDTEGLLADQRRIRYAAIAAIVVVSPAYAELLAQHVDAWVRLRTVKAALTAVVDATHGQLPERYISQVARTEPLAADRIGFPIDRRFVDAWAGALAALATDSEARLPGEDDSEMHGSPA